MRRPTLGLLGGVAATPTTVPRAERAPGTEPVREQLAFAFVDGYDEPAAEAIVVGIQPNDSDGGLVVRAKPGLQMTSVGVLANGTVVDYLGSCRVTPDGLAWWHIQSGGLSGWSSAAFLDNL